MSQRRDLQFEMAENVSCRVRIERGSIAGLPNFLADFDGVDDVVVIFDPAVEDQAQQLAQIADGVIVGSAIVKIIEENLDDELAMLLNVERFAEGLSKGVKEIIAP